MQDPSEEIEVEVVEVDGVPVEPPSPRQQRPQTGQWQWQGQLRGLSPIWWPLAFIGGVLAIALLLTVGVVIGACWLVVRLIRALLRPPSA